MPRSGGSGNINQLIAEAQEGSQEALGRLIEAYRTYLLLVANRELRTDLQAKAGASDLVQDTFLEAQRDFARFEGKSEQEFLAWLRGILLNNLANLTRRYRKTSKRRVAREVSLDDPNLFAGLRQALKGEVTSASGEAIQHEQALALERALECLPEHYRRVIVLRHRQNRSFAEIGRVLKRSADAARKLWSRAIERLQQELEPP